MPYAVKFKKKDTAVLAYSQLRDWYRLNHGANGNLGNIKLHHSTITLANKPLVNQLEYIVDQASHLTSREKKHETVTL